MLWMFLYVNSFRLSVNEEPDESNGAELHKKLNYTIITILNLNSFLFV